MIPLGVELSQEADDLMVHSPALQGLTKPNMALWFSVLQNPTHSNRTLLL